MKRLKYFLLVTDLGFIAYWTITLLHLLPDEYLYNDYTNPVLVDWNWSFFPLDMLVSVTGLTSIRLEANGSSNWRIWAMASLLMTAVSGLQAISYWAIAGDFNPAWWIPNLFLLIYPLFFLSNLMGRNTGS